MVVDSALASTLGTPGTLEAAALAAGCGVAREATGAGVAGVCCAAMVGVEDGGGVVLAR
jgi:hypothetical protein